MKSPFFLSALVSLSWASCGLAQYGYTPPVPPTPPQMPTAPDPYATYPASTGGVPPAGAGMDVGYSAPTYGSPTYGGYQSQPLAGAPGAASFGADAMLSYGYLEGYYQYTDFKNSSIDPASGLGVALSAKLFDPLFIKGGFNWASGNGGSESDDGFDFSAFSLGVGAYIPVSARFHLMCEVGGAYYKMDADRDSISFSDGALYVHPGVRVAATRSLELVGGLMFTSADDYDSIIFDVGAYWRMFSALDLKIGADFGDESTAWKAGLRVRW